ncbi:hypothetical protein AB0L74_29060 [Streptomyces sp. NPDC052020]|uniref:hypothetical protein n=1 Tax=Streptomyces sp. NPDC052020 TaxID=3155677 RepID=UPI00342673C3
MSYDVFVLRFEKGEPAPLDSRTVQEVLGPYVTARDPGTGFLRIAAKNGGGEADLYIKDESGVAINHFGGNGIMNLISDMLRRLEAVLVLPAGTVIVDRDEDRRHLPLAMRNEWSVIVAPTGEEITRAIRAS